MVLQFFSHIIDDPFLFGCSSLMAVLFTLDLLALGFAGAKRPWLAHRDFKTAIVSIGLFGTFYGVLVGLYGFNTSDIASSVPQLLEGLKFAFAISVLGMFLSITLSIIEKFIGVAADEEGQALRSIDQKLTLLTETLRTPHAFNKRFNELQTFLKDHLEHIARTLEKAMNHLARGATEEVMKALERIITDFNSNLREQFGENFKQLNQACFKLVEWQERYRIHVDTSEEKLTTLLTALEEARVAIADLEGRSRATADVCDKVGDLITTFDIQTASLATYLKQCKDLGGEARGFLEATQQALAMSSEHLGTFSHTIEKAVGKQSETLARLTSEIDEQLPKTLGELDRVLSAITNQFAADYRSLFQYITDKR